MPTMCQIWHQNRSPAAQNVFAKTQTYVSEKEIGTLKRKNPSQSKF